MSFSCWPTTAGFKCPERESPAIQASLETWQGHGPRKNVRRFAYWDLQRYPPTSRIGGLSMNPHPTKALDMEREPQQRIAEMIAEHGPQWSEPYKPGSFGCHELLDRTSMAADIVEQYVLSHPACAQNKDWFALADQAVAALRELYQRRGAEHLDDQGDATGDR